MKRSAPLTRRSALSRRPSGSRSAQGRRSTQLSPEMRRLVFLRSGGQCDCCGRPTTLETFDAHHRITRSRGGEHTLENLVALHHDCHMRWHQRDMAEARRRGLMVDTNADPGTVPVRRGNGRLYLPTARRWTPVPEGSES